MPRYLRGVPGAGIAVGICDRCKFKFLLNELGSDPNFPGLRVCDRCRDLLDPYRLPARVPENITLQYPRPDVSVALTATQAAEDDTLVPTGGEP